MPSSPLLRSAALAAVAVLALTGCAKGPGGVAPGSSASASRAAGSPSGLAGAERAKEYTNESLGALLGSVSVNGAAVGTATPESAAQINESFKKSLDDLVIEPATCQAAMRTALQKETDSRAVAVGTSDEITVSIRSYPSIAEAQGVLDAAAAQTAACSAATYTAGGEKVTVKARAIDASVPSATSVTAYVSEAEDSAQIVILSRVANILIVSTGYSEPGLTTSASTVAIHNEAIAQTITADVG